MKLLERQHDGYFEIIGQQSAEGVIKLARSAVKALGHRQRRDTAIRDAEEWIAGELEHLAGDLTNGAISTAGFVDAAVYAMRSVIYDGLQLGGHDAMLDAGWDWLLPVPDTATKAAKPNSGRYKAYAGSVAQAYNQGYGLVTIGTATDPDNIAIRWHARPGACKLCEPRDGELFTVGTLPGWPGDGGFAAEATICIGGPHCRCTLSYEQVTPEELATLVANPTPTSGSGAQEQREADAAQQRAADVATVRQALADPASLTAIRDVWEDLALDRAEAQRPYLMNLLRDVLAAANTTETPVASAPRRDSDGDGFPWLATAITAAVGAALAAQAASQVQAPQPPPAPPAAEPAAPQTTGKRKKPDGIAGDVYDYLAEHYPKKTLKWVRDAEWRGPVEVDLADVNMARRPGGARDQKKVEGIAEAVAEGKELDPCVLVETPDGLPYRIADGFHRTLGLDHAGKTKVTAWIGKVPDITGPWAKEMHEAKLNKSLGKKFNPDQPRDAEGQWAEVPGSAAAVQGADRLGLGRRIKLDANQRLVASSKVESSQWDGAAYLALVTTGDEPRLRFAVDSGLMAAYNDQRNSRHAWRATNLGRTVELDLAGMVALRDRLRNGTKQVRELYAKATPLNDKASLVWDRLGPKAVEDPEYQRLNQEITRLSEQHISIPPVGAAWGSVHGEFRVDEDVTTAPYMYMGVHPADSSKPWDFDTAWEAEELALFPLTDVKKIIKRLDEMVDLSQRINGEASIAKADHGTGDHKARHLIRWFNAGADGQINWGGPGDLTACHAVASRHMTSDQAWGFCNERHKDVLGRYNDPND